MAKFTFKLGNTSRGIAVPGVIHPYSGHITQVKAAQQYKSAMNHAYANRYRKKNFFIQSALYLVPFTWE